MARYSVVEAKNNLSALIDAAEAGEEVVITRHGKPAVQLVRPDPFQSEEAKARRAAVWAEIDARRNAMPMSPISSVDLIRQMRDEGP
jgi:prevent-host-death family protein